MAKWDLFSPGFQGWFSIQKSINVMHHIYKAKQKIIWSSQLMLKQHLTKFNTKSWKFSVIYNKRKFSLPDMGHLHKTYNIILNWEKPDVLLKLWTRQELTLLLNIVLVGPPATTWQEKEMKDIQIGKKEVELL